MEISDDINQEWIPWRDPLLVCSLSCPEMPITAVEHGPLGAPTRVPWLQKRLTRKV